MCIPPGVAHLLLPLEDSIVHDLETAIAKKAAKLEAESPCGAFLHRAFAQILHKVWRRTITGEHVALKFAKNGLFPLNSLAISNERIFAAAQTMREIPRPPSPLHHGGGALSGLSLLSALSSHEYASLEHNNQHDMSGEVTPEQPRHKSYLEEQLVAPPTPPGAVSTPLVTRKRQLQEVLERSLLQQQLEEGAGVQQPEPQSETEDKEVLAYKEVHSALVAARHNPDQISRAIDSILSDDSLVTSPSRKKLRTISDSDVKPSWKIVRIESIPGEGDAPSTVEQFSAEAVTPQDVVVHEEVIFDQFVSEEVVQEMIVEEAVHEEVVVPQEMLQEEIVQEQTFEVQQPPPVIIRKHVRRAPAVATKKNTPTGNWMSQFKEFIKIVPQQGVNNMPMSAEGDVKSTFMIKGGEVFLQPVAPQQEVPHHNLVVKGEVMDVVCEEQVVTSDGMTAVDLVASGDAKQGEMVELIQVMPNGEQILVAPEIAMGEMDSGVADPPVEVYTEDVVHQETVVSSGGELLVQQGDGGDPQTVVEEYVVEYIQMLPEDNVWEEQVV